MTEWLWDCFVHPLTTVHFQKAIIGASLASVACGVIGCFVILRQMAFLGDAISHSMLVGVTAGYLIMKTVFGYDAHVIAMIGGALLAGLVTVGAISFVSQVSRVKNDTAIGIMYTGMFALGGILASRFSHRIHIHLYDFVVGMILAVEDGHLWMIGVVTSFVLAVVIMLFRHLKITTFDPIMAASIGIPVAGMHYLLTACTSLVVVSAVPVVGIVMVVGLLITPAATAYLLSDRLGRMLFLSPVFGVSSVVLGLYLSTWMGNVATGPVIVVISTVQFLVVLALAPRYGLLADWLRRRELVPQRLIEDVLGSVRRGDGATVPVASVLQHVDSSPDVVRRAIRILLKREMLDQNEGGLCLTAAGQREARRLLRSHRLWEAYLQDVGLPEDSLHTQAHHLEHLHDEETVDYLDDKLGHPLRDPHGAEIPEDFVHLVPGAEVKSSMLREGHRAVVTHLQSGAEQTPLRVGMEVKAGRRSADGRNWTLHLPDGSEVSLDHETADSVTVTLVVP